MIRNVTHQLKLCVRYLTFERREQWMQVQFSEMTWDISNHGYALCTVSETRINPVSNQFIAIIVKLEGCKPIASLLSDAKWCFFPSICRYVYKHEKWPNTCTPFFKVWFDLALAQALTSHFDHWHLTYRNTWFYEFQGHMKALLNMNLVVPNFLGINPQILILRASLGISFFSKGFLFSRGKLLHFPLGKYKYFGKIEFPN